MKRNSWVINFNPFTLKSYLFLHSGDCSIKMEIPKRLYDDLNEMMKTAVNNEREQEIIEKSKNEEMLKILKSKLIVNHYDGTFTDICLKGHFITEDDEDFDKIKEWLEDDK